MYNLLDMLGDIGGLQYFLIIIFSLLLALLHFHRVENYLVSQMFQVVDHRTFKPSVQKVSFKSGKKVVEVDRGLHVAKLNYCRELINGICLRKGETCPCRCMQKSRMERLFDKGRHALKREMDIV